MTRLCRYRLLPSGEDLCTALKWPGLKIKIYVVSLSRAAMVVNSFHQLLDVIDAAMFIHPPPSTP